MNKHLNIIVTGKVQGVWYRGSTEKNAKQLGINGFVKNLKNGDVYIEAEGSEKQLQKLIDCCKVGPKEADVKSVTFEEGEFKNFNKFKIKRF